MKTDRATPHATARPLDSQQALALSIAREIRLDLPPDAAADDVAASVERALTEEARRNERTIAGVRAGLLVVLTVLNTAAVAIAGAPYDPSMVVYLGAAAVAALALYRALERGWFRDWLRKAVPTADAIMITGAYLLYAVPRGGSNGEIAPAVIAVAATACVFLTFSGALRLSRSAARLATGMAIGAWIAVVLIARREGLLVDPLASGAAGAAAVEIAFVVAALAATGYLGSDVTRMIRRVVTNQVAARESQRLYVDARQAVEAREEVLRIVSHDLRNPLSTISMTAELVTEMDLVGEARDQQLARIHRAGDRMNRMIQDLLDVARMESGKLSVDPTDVTCGDLLDDVAELMSPIAAERQQELRIICPADAPTIRVDRDRALQVFSNLIGNAVKFTPPGGTICVTAEPMGSRIRLSVSDTGPGIPREQLADVFGRLWQANPSDRRGLGLGLAIARSIVEAHGERIGVESRPGEGTTFWFTAARAGSAGQGA